jgi:hypothetical protein
MEAIKAALAIGPANMEKKWDAFGRRLLSDAACRRLNAQERAALIAALGWEPEDCDDARTAYSPGEMRSILRYILEESTA